MRRPFCGELHIAHRALSQCLETIQSAAVRLQLRFASYNIRKAIGLDRRRDPDRILAVLKEIDADIVALQEADRRFGRRASALPLQAIYERTPYRPVRLAMKSGSMGWHGNALLVRRGIEVTDASPILLPTLEPRGAVRVDLLIGSQALRVVGMHLDLSGLRRRHQMRSVLSHVETCGIPCPTVLMGDLNNWSESRGCFREIESDWQVLSSGRSYPSHRPLARLDRIIASGEWNVRATGAHHSALSAKGSDHLPVWAELALPKR